MRALKLTWELATPMVTAAFPLHLDALLTFAVSQHNRTTRPNDPASWDEGRELDLPLERAERDGQWCWKASALIPEMVHGHSLRFWTRPSDPYDYAKRLENGDFTTKTTWAVQKHVQVLPGI